jgi:hypothetical protein
MARLREKQKEERKRRILEAARQQFRKASYRDVTIEAIAEEAGLSAMTEYRKDKRPFHPIPTAADCCCIVRQLCNTSRNPGAMEVAALKSSPFLQP